MAFSNELSDAQLERLAILAEELGEAQQAVGKILRHGYESVNPLLPAGSLSNRDSLEKELGDIFFAVDMLDHAVDLDFNEIQGWKRCKADKIKPYLHHQVTL